MYKQIKLSDGTFLTNSVQRVSDMANIPFDPANSDYQEYLKWLEEGNEPLPPDTPETSE
jgi:hypothetical protein